MKLTIQTNEDVKHGRSIGETRLKMMGGTMKHLLGMKIKFHPLLLVANALISGTAKSKDSFD